MASIYDKASLVLIPSGSKTSKVYSQKPTNGDGDFTFSRSTAATRVNASGNIEKETQNLLLQSNTFDTTWLNAATTETGGQLGYDGTNDAWRIDKSNSGAYIIQIINASGVNTFSVYAKAGSLNWLRLNINFTSGTDPIVYFDLANGLIGSTPAGQIDAKIEDVGGGWYRCSVSGNGTIQDVRFFPADGDNDVSGTSGNIYIQDAQLEQGLVARDYIETTTAAVEGGITDNVPRLDYTDSSCPALLLEPQRTNLVTQSEVFNIDTSWLASGRPAVETNITTSPEGVQNASRLSYGSGNVLRYQNELTFTNGYSYSIFVKKDVGRYVTIYAAFFTTSAIIGFDLDEGTCQAGGVIEPYGDGWYRISVSKSVAGDADKSGYFYLYSTDALGSTISTNGNKLYVYGAQIEEGSYATSYIPTYGSAVTRSADKNITITSASSVIGQQEGTFYLEIENALNTPNAFWYNVSDSSYTNWIFCGYDGHNFRFYVRTGNSVQYDTGAAGVIGTNKIVFIYKSGAIAAFVNGTQIKDATTTFNVTASLNYVTLGSPSPAGGVIVEAYPVKQAMLFPTALTDQEAIDLTTL